MFRLRWLIRCALSACCVANLFSSVAAADELRIVTWNIREGFDKAAIQSRSAAFKQFGSTMKPDVLVVQEVTSIEVVRALRDAMGLTDYHVACSDFMPSDISDFGGFEVAIISRFPLDEVIEYDPTPDWSPTKADIPPELPLSPALKLGIHKPREDSRGFLWGRIDALRLTVAVVHLKSSRGVDGPEDYGNAQKREFVAAAVAESVLEDRGQWPEFTCLVAGDFNVGHSDTKKNGRDLYVDASTANPNADGYDDTHAIFSAGIVGKLKMTNLVLGSKESTYPDFPSTPIDNIYVAGPGAASFRPAVVEKQTFESDHRPVWTVWNTRSNATVHIPKLAAGHNLSAPAPQRSSAPSVPGKPPTGMIGVADVRKHVDQRATVEMTVATSSILANRRMGFLNSMQDFRNPDNFAVVLRSDTIKLFEAAGISDPAAHYRGKKIRVTGQLKERNGQVQVEVDDPKMIDLVEP